MSRDNTLTYSRKTGGWPSFYSYEPEMMIGMNNYFYSFKGGNLYRHNTNSQRLTFYGSNNIGNDQIVSSVTGVVNESPHDVKQFKTMSFEGTEGWGAVVKTDLGTGEAIASHFVRKEGESFAYIRTTTGGNYSEKGERGVQGVGRFSSLESVSFNVVKLLFNFEINTAVNVNDVIFKIPENINEASQIGKVLSKTNKTITVSLAGIDSGQESAPTPTVGEFIFVRKKSEDESSGLKGYYMKYTMETSSTQFSELFSIGTEGFKSYP